MPFDIYEFLKTRPLSFSALNAFADPMWGSPEKWYQSYIKGVRQTSRELTFGSFIDKKIQDDATFLPDIQRYGIMQHKMEAILELGKKKIPLIGIVDTYNKDGRIAIRDFKTGKNKWTQKKADETDQLTFYALLLYLIDKVRPEDVDFYIDWIPTYERADLSIALVEPCRPQTFKTSRTTADIIRLCSHIDKTIKRMHKFVRACDKIK